MGKNRAKRKKQALVSSNQQGKLMRAENDKRLKKLAKAKAFAETKERKKKLLRAKEGLGDWYLDNRRRVLLVGEGDFSFTKAIMGLSQEEKIKHVVATCLDSFEELKKKYPETAKPNVKAVRRMGRVLVLDNVDATALEKDERILDACAKFSEKEPDTGFDLIAFNFPHTGAGINDKFENIAHHRDLMRRFFQSAKPFLAPGGGIFVTLKRGQPYDDWKLAALGRSEGLDLKTQIEFMAQLFPGYQHRRTLGAASKSTEEGGPAKNQDISKKGAHTFVFVGDDY